MRVVIRKRAAIVATLCIVAGVALSGCGQRGSLYLPTVPPLPAKPTAQTQTPSSTDVKPGADTEEGSVPDTSGTPLSLSPDAELRSAPNATPADSASGASDAQ